MLSISCWWQKLIKAVGRIFDTIVYNCFGWLLPMVGWTGGAGRQLRGVLVYVVARRRAFGWRRRRRRWHVGRRAKVFRRNSQTLSSRSKRYERYTGYSNSYLPTNDARFFINLEYKMSTGILYVYNKYSTRDLICDIISCWVWSCDMATSMYMIKSWLTIRKKRKYGTQKSCYMKFHLKRV